MLTNFVLNKTERNMNKKEIKAHLIAKQEELLKNLEAVHQNLANASDLDEDDVIDTEDLSHQGEWQEAAHTVSARIMIAKHQLSQLKALHDDASSEICPGALVSISGKYYLVGVAFPKQVLHNTSIVGISTEAPLYQSIKGKKAGDTINWNGKNVLMESVE